MPITKYMQNQAVAAAGNTVAANTKKLLNSVITSHVDGVAAYSNKGMTVDIMRLGNDQDGRPFGVRLYAAVESFTDSYSCNFNQETVFGRTDPLPSYQNTTRSISMQLVLVADNLGLGTKNLTDAKAIAAMLYPDYNKHGNQYVFSRAPVVQMRWVNMITDSEALNRQGMLAGTIGNYTFTPDPEAGYFEYGPNSDASVPDSLMQPYDYDLQGSKIGLVPKVIRLSLDFAPLHQGTIGVLPDDDYAIGDRFAYDVPDIGSPAKHPGWEVDQSTPVNPFINGLDTESFRGVNFADLNTAEQLEVLSALGSDNAYAEEIRARNENILKQSNETTNPWTKLGNKFKDSFGIDRE